MAQKKRRGRSVWPVSVVGLHRATLLGVMVYTDTRFDGNGLGYGLRPNPSREELPVLGPPPIWVEVLGR